MLHKILLPAAFGLAATLHAQPRLESESETAHSHQSETTAELEKNPKTVLVGFACNGDKTTRDAFLDFAKTLKDSEDFDAFAEKMGLSDVEERDLLTSTANGQDPAQGAYRIRYSVYPKNFNFEAFSETEGSPIPPDLLERMHKRAGRLTLDCFGDTYFYLWLGEDGSLCFLQLKPKLK